MSIEEKIETDYKKLKSLKIAEDIIKDVKERREKMQGKTTLHIMLILLKRVSDEDSLDEKLKGDVTLMIYKNIFGDLIRDYIKATKAELGID